MVGNPAGAARVMTRCLQVYEELVALAGIERAARQFSPARAKCLRIRACGSLRGPGKRHGLATSSIGCHFRWRDRSDPVYYYGLTFGSIQR